MSGRWLFARSGYFVIATTAVALIVSYADPARAQASIHAAAEVIPPAVGTSPSGANDAAPAAVTEAVTVGSPTSIGADAQAAAATISKLSSATPPSVDQVTITHATGLMPPKTEGVTAQVRVILSKLPLVQRLKFQRALAAFPSFCQGWERKLHDREVDNLTHLDWQARNGFATATYVGYGRVESCETKESNAGVPIGKLTYEEYRYYLVGKTVREAKRAQAKLIGASSTLEIFSWDKDRWFY
jgi:hypothetical protein